MSEKTYNVLFLCTGNSARSVIGEVLLANMGKGRFKTWSAGSHPNGVVNPATISLLEEIGLPTAGLRSKSWDEFAAPGAPKMDFVFTVCDQAAGEMCPLWPGQPVTAHWGIEDPAAVRGTDEEKRRAFQIAADRLRKRIQLFISLPLERLDRISLVSELAGIGKPAD